MTGPKAGLTGENPGMLKCKFKKMNRKEFFKTTGRMLLLGGMTASAGYLVVNRQVTARCPESLICRDCVKYRRCNEPKAQEERNGRK